MTRVATCCGEDVECPICGRSDLIRLAERLEVLEPLRADEVPADVRASMEQARQARLELEARR